MYISTHFLFCTKKSEKNLTIESLNSSNRFEPQ